MFPGYDGLEIGSFVFLISFIFYVSSLTVSFKSTASNSYLLYSSSISIVWILDGLLICDYSR